MTAKNVKNAPRLSKSLELRILTEDGVFASDVVGQKQNLKLIQINIFFCSKKIQLQKSQWKVTDQTWDFFEYENVNIMKFLLVLHRLKLFIISFRSIWKHIVTRINSSYLFLGTKMLAPPAWRFGFQGLSDALKKKINNFYNFSNVLEKNHKQAS
jgi:hypothetical protein